MGRTRTIRIAVAALLVAVGAASALGTRPEPVAVAADAPTPLDCTDWRYGPADEPASLPTEYDRDDYRRTSWRDPALADSPQNLCGQKGAAVDLAWGLSQGRPDTVIAVLDSGIRWRSASDMVDLATKVHLNIGEVQPACIATRPDGDCNHDGVFNITDFGPIADRNGNGIADPEDLILDPAHSDGVDDDGNGYVDDIAGWDFHYGDNNPLDSVDYGHGTGEAKDSAAAANGIGAVGTCPKCQFIPVRVGDSFIADGSRFAAGVLFALDSGADVIQEALGAISNPPQAQQAIDAAYARGVVVVASMADEASEHPNLPSALEHTLAVNSVTDRGTGLFQDGPAMSYLALNGCTNYGGRTFVAVPSNSCSSEATGEMAGVVGLVVSYARELGVTLSADELMQIVRATADDIDFATPNAVDPANNVGTPAGGLLGDTLRYPTTSGWDATFGYGRINAYEMLKAVRDRAIPPVAMIDGPSWFALLPATGTVAVTGHVDAPRATSYDYEVQWTTGLQGPAHPGTDTWHAVGGATGRTAPTSGTLATLDLAQIAAALPDGGTGAPVDPTDADRPDPDRFSVRLRVVVTAHGGDSDGLRGEMQKQIFVHDDPDLMAGFPTEVTGASSSTPRFVDLLGDGTTQMLIATSDGRIHALRPDGSELPGFPLLSDPAAFWPTGSATAAADGITQPGGAFMIGAPAVGDLDGDGTLEIVDTDLEGTVYVWSATGERLAAMGADPAYSPDDPAAQNPQNRTFRGFLSAPSLGDLDGDGTLEIVAASMDRHVYAFHADGRTVEGFPVLVVDPDHTAAVDPITHTVTFAAGSGILEGGELVATPTLADLDGDGLPDIVIGAQEAYEEAPNVGSGSDVLALLNAAADPGNARLYAISSAGTGYAPAPAGSANPHAGAYLPGWPVKVPMLATELLPTIGDGIVMPAVVGEVDPTNDGPEIVAATAAGPIVVLDRHGTSVYGTTAGGDVPLTWSAGLSLGGIADFGADRNSNDLIASFVAFAGPSLGDLNGDDAQDVAAPTLGLVRMLDTSLADLQTPGDDQLGAWDGATGRMLPGFPRASSDMGFFVAPAIADLDGDGNAEVVAGNGVFMLNAFDASGARPIGWPKLTGGWSVGTPAVGDWDGDGTVEVAQTRRDGQVLVWHTTSGTEAQWGSWNCDAHNSGACVDAPGAAPPTTSTTTTSTSTSVVSTTTSSSVPGVSPTDATDAPGPEGPDAAVAPQRSALARTGAALGGLTLLGVALVVAGAATRRRRA